MQGNKKKIMELFLYIIIVIIGILLLMFGKPGAKPGGGVEPPEVTESIDVERGEPFAVLHDEQ